MRQSDFSVAAIELLTELAPKYVWWKPPQESLDYPQQLLASVMDLGSFEDAALLRNLVPDEFLRVALQQAEPGQFRPRSWTYWHLMLNGLVDAQVPAEPVRTFRHLASEGIGYGVIQQEPSALTVVTQPGRVLLSFFGDIHFGSILDPVLSDDELLVAASLLDLFGTKLKVILQRVQSKDYLDVGALLASGLRLEDGLAAAVCLYGASFAPSEAVKALTYFEGGDLATVPTEVRGRLRRAVAEVRDLPEMKKGKTNLSEGLFYSAQ